MCPHLLIYASEAKGRQETAETPDERRRLRPRAHPEGGGRGLRRGAQGAGQPNAEGLLPGRRGLQALPHSEERSREGARRQRRAGHEARLRHHRRRGRHLQQVPGRGGQAAEGVRLHPAGPGLDHRDGDGQDQLGTGQDQAGPDRRRGAERRAAEGNRKRRGHRGPVILFSGFATIGWFNLID